MPSCTQDDLRLRVAALWRDADDEAVYAVLDGAASDELVARLGLEGPPRRCLYAGAPPALEAAAPHLVALQPDATLTRWLLDEGWGRAWGVYLRTAAPLDALWRHLRRLLEVETERGELLTFRYYDPRVLRVYLPTCTPEELAFVFGPASRFFCEAADLEAWEELVLTGRDLDRRRAPAVSAAPPGGAGGSP